MHVLTIHLTASFYNVLRPLFCISRIIQEETDDEVLVKSLSSMLVMPNDFASGSSQRTQRKDQNDRIAFQPLGKLKGILKKKPFVLHYIQGKLEGLVLTWVGECFDDLLVLSQSTHGDENEEPTNAGHENDGFGLPNDDDDDDGDNYNDDDESTGKDKSQEEEEEDEEDDPPTARRTRSVSMGKGKPTQASESEEQQQPKNTDIVIDDNDSDSGDDSDSDKNKDSDYEEEEDDDDGVDDDELLAKYRNHEYSYSDDDDHQGQRKKRRRVSRAGNGVPPPMPVLLPNGKRKRMRFSDVEKDCIREGVRLFGFGKWSQIKSEYGMELRNRTNVDIKVCYRS